MATAIVVAPQNCIPGTGNITIREPVPNCVPDPTSDCDFVLRLEKTGSGLASPGPTIAYSLVASSELDPETGTSAIYTGRVLDDGTEEAPVVVSPAGSAFQNSPRVARSGGDFWIVWQAEDLDGSLLGVFGRRVSGIGQPTGEIQQINAYTDQDQRDPAIASDAQGNVFVVWSSYGQDGDLGGIYARLLGFDGDAIGSEFQVHEETVGFQSLPQIATDYAGNFVVAWESDESFESLGNALVARVFRANGAPLTGEIRVGGAEAEVLHLVDVQAELSGGFAVQWSKDDESEDFQSQWRQSFNSGGEALAPPEEL